MLVSKGSGARLHLTCIKHRPRRCARVIIKTTAGGPLPAGRVYVILHLDKTRSTEPLASLPMRHAIPYGLKVLSETGWDLLANYVE